MKIACQSCQAKYTIADEKVVGKVVKIRCKKCGSTIVVNGQDDSSREERHGDSFEPARLRRERRAGRRVGRQLRGQRPAHHDDRADHRRVLHGGRLPTRRTAGVTAWTTGCRCARSANSAAACGGSPSRRAMQQEQPRPRASPRAVRPGASRGHRWSTPVARGRAGRQRAVRRFGSQPDPPRRQAMPPRPRSRTAAPQPLAGPADVAAAPICSAAQPAGQRETT